MSILRNVSIESLTESYAQAKNFGVFKSEIAELVNQLVRPIREKYLYFIDNLEVVADILEKSERHAREIASENYATIREELFS